MRISDWSSDVCSSVLLLRHARDRPVVIGIFDRLRRRFGLAVDRDIAELHIVAEPAIGGIVGARDHCVQGFVRVEIAYALQIGIGDDRDGMIADHCPGLANVEVSEEGGGLWSVGVGRCRLWGWL